VSTTRQTGAMLQHLAHAVVPPPRLRAKWGVFSALLHHVLPGSLWRPGERFGVI